jgi:hypothetical protein
VPAQVTLLPGSSPQQACEQLAAAGIGLPALVKPLSSMPSDTAVVTPAAAAAAGDEMFGTTAATAAAAAARDGHALGVVLEERGVVQLLAGVVPELAPPVVVQQFVPHGEALYKVRQLAHEHQASTAELCKALWPSLLDCVLLAMLGAQLCTALQWTPD